MNYKDLLIVGYPAGYGGEFFCSVVLSSLIDYKPIQRVSSHLDNLKLSNWYSFDEYNSMGSLKSLDSLLDHCGDVFLNKNTDKVKIVSKYGKKHLSIVWDNDPEILIQNVIEICRIHYDFTKPKIMNFHYHERLRNHSVFEEFTMDTMFPGSKKIRTVCDSYYHDIFTLIYVFKTNAIAENIKMGNDDKDFFFECAFPKNRKNFLKSSFEDFVDLDVGKMFLENNDNFSEAENIISSLIGSEVKLSVDDIVNYRTKNVQIVKSVLGDNYADNSEEQNTKMILEYVSERFDKQLLDVKQ